jgi:hypothetical protein
MENLIVRETKNKFDKNSTFSSFEFLLKMLRLQNDLNFEKNLHVVSRGRQLALTGIMIRFTHLS